jgi:transcription elongation factor GreA
VLPQSAAHPVRERLQGQSVVVCATCEVEVAWAPVWRNGQAYCCQGCAAGGPCCCSYDESSSEVAMQIERLTVASAPPERGIPMTRDALRRLEEEAERLAGSLPRLQALAQEDGVSGDADSPTVLTAGDLHVTARRLEALRRVIADSHVVDPDGRAVVGSRVTVLHADGEQESYELVAPGQAEARRGRISPDSPLGAALLGRRAGDQVDVSAPDGIRRLAIVDVA